MTDSQDKHEDSTKNDTAWQELFDKYQILERIQSQGFFEITSEQINKVRESRLMAKFDHRVKLPKIFKDNQLSILPISRNKYIIGPFETYLKVDYNDEISAMGVEFPDLIESIDYNDIRSESIALNCVFNAGIIANLLDTNTSECYYTLSGRMGTGKFKFKIKNIIKDGLAELWVNHSQCEIDAGFETQDSLLIIEAKNYKVEDFLVRQLYYPYRLWKNKINKKVIPALMTYSNNLFSFFIYEFQDDEDYNSIQLVRQANYRIFPEEISREEVSEIFSKIVCKEEPENIPFPQANIFDRVIDLLSLLREKNLTQEEIRDYYEFDIRQARYYSDAGRYLGLIKSSHESNSLTLTDEGLLILSYNYKNRILSLIQKILEHKVFYDAFKIIHHSGEVPSTDEITNIMSSQLSLGQSSMERRSQTVKNWIKWIWEQID